MTSSKQMIDACFKGDKDNKQIQIWNKQLTLKNLKNLIKRKDIIYIKSLTISRGIEPQAISVLIHGDWQNLTYIRINRHWGLKKQGCIKLAQMRAPKLTRISFPYNCIGPEGVLELKKADWPNLQEIDLRGNTLGDDGCHYIATFNCKLNSILLYNEIGKQGVKSLVKFQWGNLIKLSLSFNNIGDTGCKYLSHSQWNNLQQLDIFDIRVTKTGYKWLSKAYWQSMNKIRFGSDNINWEGYKYLSHCHLLKLRDLCIYRQLDLSLTKDTYEGQFYLIKSNWKLTGFYLQDNFEKHTKQIYRKSFPIIKFKQQ